MASPELYWTSPCESNIEAALTLIEQEQSKATRAFIAKQLALSRTTASSIISQLMQLELVKELDSSINGRGRPAIPLRLTESIWYALGASYHSETWNFLLSDLYGKPVATHQVPTGPINPSHFIATLLEGIDSMLDRVPGRLLPLIGIGTPGLVNSTTGVISRADDLGWKKVAVGEPVTKHTGLPCIVMNRHRAAGLAEAQYGSGRGVKNLIYIGVETGISAAFINDGILLEGADYSAGEIGHMLIDPNGPLCGCGRYGCLQAFSSSQALVRLVEERYRSLKSLGERVEPNILWDVLSEGRLTGVFIAHEAHKGNEIALSCMKKIAVQLGIASSNLINILNPQKIIIGGGLSNAGPLLTELIRSEASSRAMESPFSTVNIEQSILGSWSGALGAASLALKRKIPLAQRWFDSRK